MVTLWFKKQSYISHQTCTPLKNVNYSTEGCKTGSCNLKQESKSSPTCGFMGFSIITKISEDVNRDRNDCTIKHLLHNCLNSRLLTNHSSIYNPGINWYLSFCLVYLDVYCSVKILFPTLVCGGNEITAFKSWLHTVWSWDFRKLCRKPHLAVMYDIGCLRFCSTPQQYTCSS